MISQIIVHLLPHEIDWFEWQCKQLKIGSVYVEGKVIMDVTLNLNLVDWRASHLPKQYFIDKFNQLKQYFDWCESIFEVNDDNTCLGIDDKRRTSIRKYSPDNFVYLDCDIIFTPETLAILMNGAKAINNKYYIISPQVPKLWDYTWDVISSEYYKNEDYGFEKIVDPFSLLNTSYGDMSLVPLNTFKFGGGWFNIISADLLKLTDIPDSFGPYGIDDTYVMYCCEIMKHMNPKQYVMNNLLVAENYKYRNNPYTNYLSIIDKKDKFRKKAEINFQTELNKFHDKIHSNNNN